MTSLNQYNRPEQLAGHMATRLKPIVFAIDDDEGMLTSLAWLLSGSGIESRCFQSVGAFLAAFDPNQPCCIVIDVRMPVMTGLDLYDIILERKIVWPVIFVTANATLAMAVNAIKTGAFDFIEKPYNPADMLVLITKALAIAAQDHARKLQGSDFDARFQSLSRRETEVLREVVRGKQSKTIAFELGISEKTVDVHRTSIRRKFKTQSVAALVNDVLSHIPDWQD
jgi:two-component system, LuxR family, response regulator FixJ